MATEQWEVATGGPAVIGTPQPWFIDEREEKKSDDFDRLEKWIRIVGTPWEMEIQDGGTNS